MTELEVRIIKKEVFSKEVEDFRRRTNTSIMDSIIHCAAERGIEIETISSLLTHDIKERLEGEARRLNLIEPKDTLKFE